MKKVLKNLVPSIRPYLGDAFCFSIIDDVAFDSGWVYDKYIHIEYTPYDGQIKYADYDYYDFVPDQGVFIKSFIEYPYKFCTQEVICNTIKRMIDNNEYCFALWDETVVTNHLFHQEDEEIYEHGCFVYGYDDESEVFLSQGYIQNERWEHFDVPFDVFYEAISYCPQKGEIALIGYKPRLEYEWKFDYDRMKKNMHIYMERGKENVGDNFYDINAVKSFFSNLEIGKIIHYPSLYCMYEHKVIFTRRLEFLLANHLFVNEEVVAQAKRIAKTYRKIMLLGIQYNASMDSRLLGVICDEVKKVVTEEREMLMEIVLV